MVSLIGADDLIWRLLWNDHFDVGMPVRRKIGMQPVYKHPKAGVYLVLNVFLVA